MNNCPPERILVFGGRKFTDHERVFCTLDDCRPYFAKDFCIIEGGATGADSLAAAWAAKHGLPCLSMRAQWRALGRRAGMLRNAWMLRWAMPDLCISFPGGPGTANMTKIARAAGLIVYKG